MWHDARMIRGKFDIIIVRTLNHDLTYMYNSWLPNSSQWLLPLTQTPHSDYFPWQYIISLK